MAISRSGSTQKLAVAKHSYRIMTYEIGIDEVPMDCSMLLGILSMGVMIASLLSSSTSFLLFMMLA